MNSIISKTKIPRYWENELNQKKFLEKIQNQFNIKTPKDWGNITVQDIHNAGGAYLIRKHHKGSLFNFLKSIYPDIEWKRDWFITLPYYNKSYWKSTENHRKFLEEMKEKFQIEKPSDWGKVTVQNIKDSGGISLLTYYNGSLLACLQSAYKDIHWKKEWFPTIPIYPHSYWKSITNRKNFLDNLKTKFKIKHPRDWGNLKIQDIRKVGGGTLLNGYYEGSLFKCLQSVYKEIDWKREWFPALPKFPMRPRGYWNSVDNCRMFLDKFAKHYDINNLNDWRKVSGNLISRRGGKGLLSKYDGSMKSVLDAVYAPINWDLLFEFQEKGATSQMQLEGLIQGVFANENVIVNHRKHKNMKY